MRRARSIGAALVGLAIGVGGMPAVATADDAEQQPWIVTLESPEVAAAAVLDDSVAGDPSPTEIGPRHLLVEATDAEIAELRADPTVASVVPDQPVEAAGDANDPCYRGPGCPVAASQTALRRIGASLAWDVVTGAPSPGAVVVAVIDTGVDPWAPELGGRVTLVPEGGCPGILPGSGLDDATNSHGTAVAGVIAAAGNNLVGIAGVVPGSISILSYKVLASNGSGQLSAVIAGINCAVNAGVDVINLSLVTTSNSPPLADAVSRALAAGIVVVAAAGNGGSTSPATVVYPAASPGVLGVASTNLAGARSTFSNGGSWVAISAPGEAVLSTARSGGYATLSGTSLAASFVSGAAALILARAPSATGAQVVSRIVGTAEPLVDPALGVGLVDLATAVRFPIAGSPPCSTVPGYRLDGWGGIQPVGGAAQLAGGPYWYGWDIARDVGTAPGRAGAYVLDGWGGVHPATSSAGTPPPLTGGTYWYGWDIARGVARRPDGLGAYVLDGFGGVHLLKVAGTSPVMGPGGPYWPGWDIARDLAVDPTNSTRGYVLDGFGGVHPFGFSTPVTVTGYFRGWDHARRLVVLPSGNQGYVLDVTGRLYPFAAGGTALPPSAALATFGYGSARGIDVRSGQLGAAVGYGATIPVGSTPCVGSNGFGSWDIVRSFAAAP